MFCYRQIRQRQGIRIVYVGNMEPESNATANYGIANIELNKVNGPEPATNRIHTCHL